MTSLISKFLWYCFLLYIRELHSNFVEFYIYTNFIDFLLLLNKFPWCFHDLFFKLHCYKSFIFMCRCFLFDWCMFIWKNCKSLIECTVCIIFQVFEISFKKTNIKIFITGYNKIFITNYLIPCFLFRTTHNDLALQNDKWQGVAQNDKTRNSKFYNLRIIGY